MAIFTYAGPLPSVKPATYFNDGVDGGSALNALCEHKWGCQVGHSFGDLRGGQLIIVRNH